MTSDPPPAGPVVVLRDVTVGSAPAGRYWNWSARLGAEGPKELWTMTSTIPFADAGSVAHGMEGATAVMVPSSLIVKDAAGWETCPTTKETPVADATFTPQNAVWP